MADPNNKPDTRGDLARIKAVIASGEATRVDPLTQQHISNLETDRALKERYANCFIVILIIQLLVMNTVFICAGVGLLEFKAIVLEIYLGGTLAEVFGIVLVITKNLFPLNKNS